MNKLEFKEKEKNLILRKFIKDNQIQQNYNENFRHYGPKIAKLKLPNF